MEENVLGTGCGPKSCKIIYFVTRVADGSQTACTAIPQYSLVAAYDSGHSRETDDSDADSAASRASTSDVDMGSPPSDRLSPSFYLPVLRSAPHTSTPNFSPRSQELFGGSVPTLTPSPQTQFPRFVSDLESPTTQHAARLKARAQDSLDPPISIHTLPHPSTIRTPSNDILPSTPPRLTTGLLSAAHIHKSVRIPDFVQVLEHSQQRYPTIPQGVIRRVIMTVEIKAEPKNHSFNWLALWEDQVMGQVTHAFDADSTLKYLGAIMTFGRRWVYCVVRRPPVLDTRTMSERRDPTFPSTGTPASWSDDSMREDWPRVVGTPSLPVMERPSFIPEAKSGDPGDIYEFYLLDDRQESLRAFADILDDLRRHNRDMWV
jgi:hypothetical protein